MIRCRLGFHNWRRIGQTKPVRKQSEFVQRVYVGHFALGECERCGVRSLRQVTGWWEWYHSDELTKDNYEEQYNKGQLHL
ncbi:hypothetical protein LCGC14_1107790 [marine sediment metagenome]|uniref:Uncharacterized protein n=1 Tax=marine sediment metagenome TaxID=412755 RepID=A0A0F9QDX0_9ZZZZ